MLYKGENFHEWEFPFLQTKSFLKGIYSTKKELATKGSKFFPYRVNPFSGCIPQFRTCEPGQKFKYLGVGLKISLKILVAAHFGKN